MLGAIGVLFTIGFVDFLFRSDRKAPWWAMGMSLFILVILPLLCSFFLLRSHIPPQVPCPCPNCGSLDRERTLELRNPRRWSFFYFGGWIFPALWRASRQSQFQCIACQTLYFSETRSSRTTKFLLWIFFVLMVLGWMLELLKIRQR